MDAIAEEGPSWSWSDEKWRKELSFLMRDNLIYLY